MFSIRNFSETLVVGALILAFAFALSLSKVEAKKSNYVQIQLPGFVVLTENEAAEQSSSEQGYVRAQMHR